MTSGRSIPVCVDGVDYPSIAAAARALGISKQALIQRNGMPGYEGQRSRHLAFDAIVVNGVKRSTDRLRKWRDRQHDQTD